MDPSAEVAIALAIGAFPAAPGVAAASVAAQEVLVVRARAPAAVEALRVWVEVALVEVAAVEVVALAEAEAEAAAVVVVVVAAAAAAEGGSDDDREKQHEISVFAITSLESLFNCRDFHLCVFPAGRSNDADECTNSSSESQGIRNSG